MKLYYSPGACSVAAHIALREAERTFDLERVDLRTHRTASGADYLAINPKGYVPALQLDGPGSMILTENAAVLQYIADLVPEKGLAPPNGTFARYHLQEWLGFVGSEMHKQFGPLFHPDTPALTQERLRGRIGSRLDYLNGQLVAILRWCERFDIDLQLYPNVDDYFLRIQNRPTVQAALGAEGLLEHKRFRRTA